jgi:phosphoglycolate phosphatase-like HAD superfamily hydrolase
MNRGNYEQDYQRVVTDVEAGKFLPGTSVEIIHPIERREPPRHVLFDFDGTVSLIREGWPEVMVPMMVKILQATGTKESDESLHALVADFVGELTGKQTIYQMIRLVEEIEKRGGKPVDPVVYKQMYLDLLMVRIADRREALRSGRAKPQDMVVPCAFELLDELRRRGATLYVASGTDEPFVIEEVRLLQLDGYFGRHIYGALDDYKNFSKAMVIERILRENRLEGTALLGFGDGFVEIQNVKSVGGTAVGVASDESGRSGKPDPWKRDRLIGVGADLIIPDFRDYRKLVSYLWNDQ